MTDRIKQPGQPSPIGQLQSILDRLRPLIDEMDKWLDAHESEGDPFASHCAEIEDCRDGLAIDAGRLRNAIADLRKDHPNG